MTINTIEACKHDISTEISLSCEALECMQRYLIPSHEYPGTNSSANLALVCSQHCGQQRFIAAAPPRPVQVRLGGKETLMSLMTAAMLRETSCLLSVRGRHSGTPVNRTARSGRQQADFGREKDERNKAGIGALPRLRWGWICTRRGADAGQADPHIPSTHIINLLISWPTFTTTTALYTTHTSQIETTNLNIR